MSEKIKHNTQNSYSYLQSHAVFLMSIYNNEYKTNLNV